MNCNFMQLFIVLDKQMYTHKFIILYIIDGIENTNQFIKPYFVYKL